MKPEPAPVFLGTNLGLNCVWEKEHCDEKWVISGWGCAEVKRWSVGKKKAVVLRLLRGESVDEG